MSITRHVLVKSDYEQHIHNLKGSFKLTAGDVHIFVVLAVVFTDWCMLAVKKRMFSPSACYIIQPNNSITFPNGGIFVKCQSILKSETCDLQQQCEV